MKGELYHVQHPGHSRKRWALFYIILAAVLIAAFLLVAGRIRTYTVPAGAISLTVPYKTYLVGEPITFTVSNGYNSAIYITNKCPHEPLAVYRQEGEVWKRIHAETETKNCSDADRQVRVAPGGQQSGSYANWPSLFAQPGKYRIVAYVEYFNAAPYQDFEIISRPVAAPAPARPTIRTRSYPAPLPTTRQFDDEEGETKTTGTTQPTATGGGTATPSSQSKTVSTNAGSINVRYTSNYITVLSVSPSPGCTYEGGQSGAFVEVTFKCSGSETQIQLWLSGGTLRTKIE